METCPVDVVLRWTMMLDAYSVLNYRKVGSWTHMAKLDELTWNQDGLLGECHHPG